MAMSVTIPQALSEKSAPITSLGLPPDDLFYSDLVRRYVEAPRFVTRDWLAADLGELIERADCRFVLLTAEPGAGKSSFLAQLASDNPGWPRYFIRKNQRESSGELSTKSFLLRIGFQLAALYPEAFDLQQVRIEVEQDVGKASDAIGAEISRISSSPFHRTVIRIRQRVMQSEGTPKALRIGELIDDPRLLEQEDLQELALIRPARVLQRLRPEQRIIILVDALDELVYHGLEHDVLDWLTNCPPLPANVRFVISSRPSKGALLAFIEKQSGSLLQMGIAAADTRVRRELQAYVEETVSRSDVNAVLEEMGRTSQEFVKEAVDKADGNLGYVAALSRAIDTAGTGEGGGLLLKGLLALKQLPDGMAALFEFFLHQLMRSKLAGQKSVTIRDPETGRTGIDVAWNAVYRPALEVLTVAREPLSASQLQKLTGMLADRIYLFEALGWLDQFLDTIGPAYRLYHAALSEFLTDAGTKDNPATEDLWVDRFTVQRRLVDHYWTRFAGDWTRCDDQYALNQIAAHLIELQDERRLRQLLCKEWMKARCSQPYPSGYVGFRADIDSGWKMALKHAETQDGITEVIRLQSAKLVGRALIGVASDLDLQALTLLGRASEAIAETRARADWFGRCDGLLTIHDALTRMGKTDPAILDEAETAARTGSGEDRQCRALARIGVAFSSMDDKRAGTLLKEARQIAINRYFFEEAVLTPVEGGHWGPSALANVGDMLLQARRYREAWGITETLPDDDLQRKIVLALVGDLAFDEARKLASSIKSDASRDAARASIVAGMVLQADYAGAEELLNLIAVAQPKIEAMCLVAKSLPSGTAGRMGDLLDSAAAVAQQMGAGSERDKALACLAAALAKAKRYQDAERTCSEISDFNERLRALLVVAGVQMETEVAGAERILGSAIAAAASLEDDRSRDVARRILVDSLVAVNRYLQAEQIAYSISDDYYRTAALFAIARACVSKGDVQGHTLAGRAIESARVLNDESSQVSALLELGEMLAQFRENHALAVLDEVWNIALKIYREKGAREDRLNILSRVVYALTIAGDIGADAKLADVLTARRIARTEAEPDIEKLADVLLASATPMAARNIIPMIGDEYGRFLRVCKLGEALVASRNEGAEAVLDEITQNFAHARKFLDALTNADDRARKYSRLAVVLHSAGCEAASAAFVEAERAAKQIDWAVTRDQALAVVAKDYVRCGLYELAEPVASLIGDEWLKSGVVKELVSELANHGLLPRAEQVARQIQDASTRLYCLIVLGDVLQHSDRSRVKGIAGELEALAETLEDVGLRAWARREVARFLVRIGDARSDLLFRKARLSAQMIEDAETRANEMIELGRALHGVNPELSHTVFREAQSAALDMRGMESMTGAFELPMKGAVLQTLAATLADCGEFEEAKRVVASIEDDDCKAGALRELGEFLAAAVSTETEAVFAQAGQQLHHMSDFRAARGGSRALAISLARTGNFETAGKLFDTLEFNEFMDAALTLVPLLENTYPGIAREVICQLSSVGGWIMPKWQQVYEGLRQN